MTSESDQAVQTLSQLSAALTQESNAVEAVRIEDPVNAIESSLTDFARDSFDQVREDRKFKDIIKDAIATRLGEANIKQLMDFYRDVQAGETGATSVLIGPLAAIESAKMTAEIEAHQLPTAAAEDRVFKRAGKDVLQGIVQLNQLLEAINANRVNPIEVVDDVSKKS